MVEPAAPAQPKRGKSAKTFKRPRAPVVVVPAQPAPPPPQPVVPPPAQPAVAQPPPTASQAPAQPALDLHSDLTLIIRNSLGPLLTVVGMVAVKLRMNDSSPLFARSIDELVVPANTVGQFLERNRDLGVDFLRNYVSEDLGVTQSATAWRVGANLMDFDVVNPRPPTDGGPGIDQQIAIIESLIASARAAIPSVEQQIAALGSDPRNTQRKIELATQPQQIPPHLALLYDKLEALKQQQYDQGVSSARKSDLSRKYAPVWAFEAMGSVLIRKLLTTTCWGAFEAAYSKIRRIQNCERFTLNELIASQDVHDVFAFMISTEYLMSGNNLTEGGSSGGSAKYHNIIKAREVLAGQTREARIFFECFVKKRGNRFRASFMREYEERKNSGAMSDAEIRMYDEYAKMLPMSELFYSNR